MPRRPRSSSPTIHRSLRFAVLLLLIACAPPEFHGFAVDGLPPDAAITLEEESMVGAGLDAGSSDGVGQLTSTQTDPADSNTAPMGEPSATPGPTDSTPAADAEAGALSGPEWAYWVDSDGGRVRRAALDGNAIETLVSGLGFLRSIALDIDGGKMYWTDSGEEKVQRANLDGSALEDLVLLDSEADPVGIALDVERGKVYWVDQGAAPKVQRANLDGSEVEAVISSDLAHPYGIALDVEAELMYWVDNELGTLERASLDGTERTVLSDALDVPIEVMLDPARGKVWWTDLGLNSDPGLYRANLDGSDIELAVAEVSTPLGLALDPVLQAVYWIDGGSTGRDVLERAALDGSNIEQLRENLADPRGLALW